MTDRDGKSKRAVSSAEAIASGAGAADELRTSSVAWTASCSVDVLPLAPSVSLSFLFEKTASVALYRHVQAWEAHEQAHVDSARTATRTTHVMITPGLTSK
ncbi:unnamed protein product [Phytophthora fragariaefolia]|uniref:Unnamed protein product n=1 Tax=Phytophthora fragariaefolia TaxID=1490495 RepID=A0A9W6XGR3_9STRA|nr:unnamed protein product [Phytophthora fragariaefolia]